MVDSEAAVAAAAAAAAAGAQPLQDTACGAERQFGSSFDEDAAGPGSVLDTD